jgi:hypothetical protein
MNKKLALMILFFGNLLGAVILWIGYHALSKFFFDVDNQVEVVEFSSRSGFFIVGIPIINGRQLRVSVIVDQFGFIDGSMRIIYFPQCCAVLSSL